MITKMNRRARRKYSAELRMLAARRAEPTRNGRRELRQIYGGRKPKSFRPAHNHIIHTPDFAACDHVLWWRSEIKKRGSLKAVYRHVVELLEADDAAWRARVTAKARSTPPTGGRK